MDPKRQENTQGISKNEHNYSKIHESFNKFIILFIFNYSHLPELLVAAFVKRMARLSLIAPPTDIKIMAAFIGNLLIRHPSLKVLIQNDSTGELKLSKV